MHYPSLTLQKNPTHFIADVTILLYTGLKKKNSKTLNGNLK